MAEVKIEKPKSEGRMEMHHVEIHPDNKRHKGKFKGGAVHVHKMPSGNEFGPSQVDKKSFGADEGGKLLAHVGSALGIPHAGEEASESEHNPVGEPTEVEEA